MHGISDWPLAPLFTEYNTILSLHARMPIDADTLYTLMISHCLISTLWTIGFPEIFVFGVK